MDEGNKMGIGIIVRDREREISVSLSAKRTFQSRPVLVEYMTMWRAMALCQELYL